MLYICSYCRRPTFFENNHQYQTPGPMPGRLVEHLPSDVAGVCGEVRRAMTVAAFSLVSLGCRKLLTHVAVEKGAQAGKSFLEYVTYLDQERYITRDAQKWVDLLRTKGNVANHEVVVVDEADARQLLGFVEMLLRLVYEFPNSI